MTKAFLVVLLLALAGCAGSTPYQREPSPCEVHGEASYACQIQRYHDVAA
jgi:hypothetical protein